MSCSRCTTKSAYNIFLTLLMRKRVSLFSYHARFLHIILQSLTFWPNPIADLDDLLFDDSTPTVRRRAPPGGLGGILEEFQKKFMDRMDQFEGTVKERSLINIQNCIPSTKERYFHKRNLTLQNDFS